MPEPSPTTISESNSISDDIQTAVVDGTEYVVVGTAHISKSSVELVRNTIQDRLPDYVCIELDRQRYASLIDAENWSNLDVKAIIRRKQLSTLLVQLLLAAFQKRLGQQSGVVPGTEMLEAARTAEDHQIPVELCDRDVRVTMKRAWHSMKIPQRVLLLSAILGTVFDRNEFSEEELEEFKQQDMLSQLIQDLGTAFPGLKHVLIDERDQYIAGKIRQLKAKTVVVVVGAGHVQGIMGRLNEPNPDLSSLEEIPASGNIHRYIGWGIPILILSCIVIIGLRKGAAAAGENLLYWILANGIPCSIGAAACLAHPGTIVAAFLAAPITSLTPVIGAGYVTAFVQAWLQPPRVHEVATMATDASHWRRWWSNRMLKIFLTFLLPGLGSMIGTWVGGFEIVKNMF